MTKEVTPAEMKERWERGMGSDLPISDRAYAVICENARTSKVRHFIRQEAGLRSYRAGKKQVRIQDVRDVIADVRAGKYPKGSVI